MDNNLCSKPVQQTYSAEEVAKILGVSIRKLTVFVKQPKTSKSCVWESVAFVFTRSLSTCGLTRSSTP
jgi:ABC-type sulfate transport system permease component